MGRAPNGHSSIYLGADQRWHTYITVGHKPDGTLDRRHIARRTAGEVAAAADELRARVERGSATAAAARLETVADWLTYWLDHVVRPGLAYTTAAGYASIIRTHLIPQLGHWRLDGRKRRLEPEHVEALYARMRSAGLASSYVLQAHRVLRKALKDAMRRGRVSRNVCDMIDAPRARRRRIDSHTFDEVQRILGAAMDEPEPARWLVGMLLGLRQGEVLGLRWHRLHLDVAEPFMEVSQQLQRRRWEHGCDDPAVCARPRCRTQPCSPGYAHGCDGGCGKRLAYACPQRRQGPCGRHTRACPPLCRPACTGHARGCPQRRGGGLVEVDVKSEKGERDVPLPPIVVEQLRTTRERQIRRYAERGRRWDPRGLVFVNDQFRPVDPRRDHEQWEQLLVRAGVDDSRLHAGRHDAATYLLATGTDSRVVQEILGHSRLAVTEAYLDVAADLKRQAVERMATALLDGGLAALLQGPGASAQRQWS